MVYMSVLVLVDTLGVRIWENNFFSLCENDHYKGPLCGRAGTISSRHFSPSHSTLLKSVSAGRRPPALARPDRGRRPDPSFLLLPLDPLYNDAEKSPKLGRHSLPPSLAPSPDRPAVSRDEKKARFPPSLPKSERV